MLYHRSPNLRGDDVAELQRRLGRLGFDAGRVDGIFGPLTARALDDFQRNIGLPPDGICGYETIHALQRLGDRTTGPSIATVREAEQLRRAPARWPGAGSWWASSAASASCRRAVAKALRHAGATVMTLDEPDGSAHALAANRFGADLYLGLAPTDGVVTIAYYAVPGFESVGGRRLAHLLHDHLAKLFLVADDAPRRHATGGAARDPDAGGAL